MPAGGERILQRDHGQVFFSLNAFALKHISLFKDHSPWMAIAAFVRLSALLHPLVMVNCIVYRFCQGFQMSLILP